MSTGKETADWRTTQRTHEPADYRVEQGFNLQVVDDKIYYAWEQRDESDEWQTWTASSDVDGSSFKSVRRTTTGGGIPLLQVVGNKIYYLYPGVKSHAGSTGSRPGVKLFNNGTLVCPDALQDRHRQIPDIILYRAAVRVLWSG